MAEHCDCCEESYSTIYRVPDEVWEQIKPPGASVGAGLLCPKCAMVHAECQGIVLYWEASTGWWLTDAIEHTRLKRELAEVRDSYRVFREGNMWCAVGPDFINLQESNAAFGATPEEAFLRFQTLKASPQEIVILENAKEIAETNGYFELARMLKKTADEYRNPQEANHGRR